MDSGFLRTPLELLDWVVCDGLILIFPVLIESRCGLYRRRLRWEIAILEIRENAKFKISPCGLLDL